MMHFFRRFAMPARHKLNRIRTTMRGYRKLKQQMRFDLIRSIKTDFADARISGMEKETGAPLFFGAGANQAEKIVRQLVIQRHCGGTLSRAFLHQLGGAEPAATYALPAAWRQVLAKHGVGVKPILSSFAWGRLMCRYWVNGVVTGARLLYTAIKSTLLPPSWPSGRYAYFDGLSPGNLPLAESKGTSHDILTWYWGWPGRLPGITSLRHGVPGQDHSDATPSITYALPPFQLLSGAGRIARYCCWLAEAAALSALDLLRGRWWHAYVLSEAAKAKAVALCPHGRLAAEYLFHYSGTVYRPMWTYEAIAKGARVVCYFYSTSEQVRLPSGYMSQRFEWGAANWPMYLVWDEYQAAVIRRDIDKDAHVEVVGPIHFSTSAMPVPAILAPSIAVFDLQPHRRALHFGFSTLAEYVALFPDVQYRFLIDICHVLNECGVLMVLKPKREMGRWSEKRYNKLLLSLSRSERVTIIPPAVSAIKVIEKCQAMLSMPFTSTALYLRDKNIPSAYYDPTNWLQKDDPGAHGMPILSGVDELRDWVRTTLRADLAS